MMKYKVGNTRLNLVKIVSYFETNAEMFVRERAKVDGYKKVKDKLDWMFNRISSEIARDAARPNYKKWRKELDSKFN